MLAVGLLACERSEPPAPATAGGPHDAQTPPAPASSDPPLPPAGNLRDELAAFTDVGQCVRSTRIDSALLGDALLHIGYESLVEDACTAQQAIKRLDRSACQDVQSLGLRLHCERLVAIRAAEPDQCPLQRSREPERGREPSCVALASGRAAVCAGEVSLAAEHTCRALLADDAALCLPLEANERARCEREVARLKGLLPHQDPSKPLATAARLTLQRLGASDRLGEPFELRSHDVERGVVLVRQLGGDFRVRLGQSSALPVRGLAPPSTAAVHLALDVAFDGSLRELELDVPGEASFALPGGSWSGQLEFVEPPWGARTAADGSLRGKPLRLRLEGTLRQGEHALAVRGELITFVRDVVDSEQPERARKPIADAAAAAPSSNGEPARAPTGRDGPTPAAARADAARAHAERAKRELAAPSSADFLDSR